jgi:hypothetical protein
VVENCLLGVNKTKRKKIFMKVKFLIYKKRNDGISLCGEYLSFSEARKRLKHFINGASLDETVVLKTMLYIPNYILVTTGMGLAGLLTWYLI